MRFTFPILTLNKGGAQRMLVEIIEGLLQRGHEVTILMPSLGIIEFQTHALLIKTDKSVLTESDYPSADVIVSNFYLTVPSAQSASEHGKGIHVRFSLCYEPMFLPEQSISFPSYQMTPRLIVLSKYQQSLILLNHGIKGLVVPIGVSSTFRNLHIRPSHGPLQISAIVRKPEGGWSWHRQQDHLIDQLQMIKNKYPSIEVNLICPPVEFHDSPALQGLAGMFRFCTPSDDNELCGYYNQADIFIASSIFEAAPLPGLEAMKCGAALVTTYAGGNTEYCRHEQNCLISYAFENRLYPDVMRLIDDPSLRKKLAIEGEKEANKWTWKISVNMFEKAIYELM